MGRLILKNKIVIFKLNICNSITLIGENNCQDADCKKLTVNDSGIISDFYLRNNYGLYSTDEEVEEEFNRGSDYYGTVIGGKVVAGMWIHRGGGRY